MLFAALALADIAKEADEQQLILIRYRRYGQLDRKFLSVLSKRRYFDALSHDRLRAGLKEPAQPSFVRLTVARRNDEPRHVPADDFRPREAECLGRPVVPIYDLARAIHDDDRIEHRIENQSP